MVEHTFLIEFENPIRVRVHAPEMAEAIRRARVFLDGTKAEVRSARVVEAKP